MNIAHRFKKLIVTEKTASMQESGVYVFYVSKNTNKSQIARDFEMLYGVKPAKVNMCVVRGKTTTRRGVKRKDRKKALIFLPAGKTIDINNVKSL